MDNVAPRETVIIGPTRFRQWIHDDLAPLL